MSISLAHDRTAAILRDRSGLVWVANERGIDIHNPANRSVDTVLDGAGLAEDFRLRLHDRQRLAACGWRWATRAST